MIGSGRFLFLAVVVANSMIAIRQFSTTPRLQSLVSRVNRPVARIFSSSNSFQMGSRPLSVDFEVVGRVQGVFFRAYTKDKADSLGLKGWVRNTELGTVKGVIQGSEDKIDEMKV